jgi:hypothetical protein
MQTPSTATEQTQKQTPLWATRLKLSAILALPILMIAASTFVYLTGVGMPTGTKNRGVLVAPAQQIADQLSAIDGQEDAVMPGQQTTWSMLYREPPGGCMQSCLDELYFIRQTHVAIGKYSHLIKRYYLPLDGQLNTELLELYPQMLQLAATDPLNDKLKLVNQAQTPMYYLVDKQGFLMMTYNAENTLKDYITDLKFLFSNSE